MNILTICGSTRQGSKNQALLNHLPELTKVRTFQYFAIKDLPTFHPDLDSNPIPEKVVEFRLAVAKVDAVLIATPEYLHNMPAILKNALEWLTKSGELADKPVLAIVYTPHEPRGEKAMQSLLWTLTALKSRVVASLNLYHTDLAFEEDGMVKDMGGKELLLEAIQLFS